MKKLLLTCVLAGYASIVFSHPPLPVEVVGEWVRADFKASADRNAEPAAGSAIYLLADGRAMVWCPEAGVPCLATYEKAGHILRLKQRQTDLGPFTPVSARYVFDPANKTLSLLQSRPPESAAFLKLEVYHWRQSEVPDFVRLALRQP